MLRFGARAWIEASMKNVLAWLSSREPTPVSSQLKVIGADQDIIVLEETRPLGPEINAFELTAGGTRQGRQRVKRAQGGYYTIVVGWSAGPLTIGLVGQADAIFSGQREDIPPLEPGTRAADVAARAITARRPTIWRWSGGTPGDQTRVDTADPSPARRASGHTVRLASTGALSLRQPRGPMHTKSPILICVVRNEQAMLPQFIAHYRRLGVRNFIFIDNDSDDGTSELLAQLNEGEIAVYHTKQTYRDANSGIDWVNAVIDYVTRQLPAWFLVVDADELLVYPACARRTLDHMVAKFTKQKSEAMFTLLLDVYADRSFRSYDDLAFDEMRYFDREGYFVRTAARFPFIQVFGGPRARAFATTDFSLKKVALFRSDGTVKLAVGAHALTQRLMMAAESGLLLHYKFNSDWLKKIRAEAEDSRRTQAKHYKTLYSTMLESEDTFYAPQVSEPIDENGAAAKHLMARRDLNPDGSASLQTIGVLAAMLSRATRASVPVPPPSDPPPSDSPPSDSPPGDVTDSHTGAQR